MTLLVVLASVFLVFLADAAWRGKETPKGPVVIVGAALGLVLLSIPASHLYWHRFVNDEAAALRPISETIAEARASGASYCMPAALGERFVRFSRRRSWAKYFAGKGPVPPYSTFPGFLGPFWLWVPSDVDLGALVRTE